MIVKTTQSIRRNFFCNEPRLHASNATADLIKARNFAFMTFLLSDKIPLNQHFPIAAGELDSYANPNLAQFDEDIGPFGLTHVRPKRWHEGAGPSERQGPLRHTRSKWRYFYYSKMLTLGWSYLIP